MNTSSSAQEQPWGILMLRLTLPPRRYRLAALAIAAAGILPAACTGPGSLPTPTPDGASAEDVAPDAASSDAIGGDAAVTPTDVCLEVEDWPIFTGRTSYVRKTWDPQLRILTQEASQSPPFAAPISTVKWRYASEGRIIAYIGVEQPFQHDYRYDEHDNVIEVRDSYPQTPDLMTPSTASTWIDTSYDNQYSPTGRLIGSTITSFGEGAGGRPPVHRTYVEDDAGRCKRVESVSPDVPYVQERTYDDAGRLWRIEATTGSGTSASTRTDTTTYDDQSRVQRWTIVLSAVTSRPGLGTVTRTYDHAPDGSETIRTEDDTTDVLDDRLVILTRSPYCQTIDAAIGEPADQRCRVP
jgi:hypothetical protein